MERPGGGPERRGQHSHRVGTLLTSALLLAVVGLLPLLLIGGAEEIGGLGERRFFAFGASGPPAPSHTRLTITVTHLDEQTGVVSLRIAGHHLCTPACDWSDRIVFFSIASDDESGEPREGLPPSAAVILPASRMEVTQTIQLPTRGTVLRYPFDSYRMTLAVAFQRVQPDGSVQRIAPAEATGQLYLSIREQLPRLTFGTPEPLPTASLYTGGDPYSYLYAVALDFQRPIYLQVLVALLVLLISAAAAYAVFIGPLEDLLINYGTVILGVWGIRAILTPGDQTSVTGLDLSLALIIVFLLGAIATRALFYCWERSRLPRRPLGSR